ncbi:hypothetical protein HPB51_028104 [Rhipicephalus microplus]|uniref:Uncharacterized protein n=1 Tax=Rhipicephalus microplus TaxID=6941 RepID=A0A9J6CYQ4_RHIMP|nr:hypothetical protein HPB51_028104 [Rhipicephalus microplus]
MVGHLLKSIAEDVYNFLIGREDLTSVSAVQRHCRTFEKLKTRRIAPKLVGWQMVTTVTSVDVSPSADLAVTIRAIVREELQRQGGWVDETSLHPPTSPPYYTAAPLGPLQPSVCVTDISETKLRGHVVTHSRPTSDMAQASSRPRHTEYLNESTLGIWSVPYITEMLTGSLNENA